MTRNNLDIIWISLLYSHFAWHVSQHANLSYFNSASYPERACWSQEHTWERIDAYNLQKKNHSRQKKTQTTADNSLKNVFLTTVRGLLDDCRNPFRRRGRNYEFSMSDKWRIHHPYPSSWRDFHCLMGSGNFNYEGLGSISSWDWFLVLQSLQMIGKFLFMVPYTNFSLTIRQWNM